MESLIPVFVFIVISTGTPGPNNLLLATVGMRFGFRAAIPHVIGIHTGMYTLLGLCAIGLNQIIIREPVALLGLKIFGSGYLLYLAWKILGIRLHPGQSAETRPLTIPQAFLFQFSNPKGWMMITSGLAIALPLTTTMLSAVTVLVLGWATLGLACNLAWVAMGSALKSLYARDTWRKWINAVLAALTLLTVLMFWMP